MIYLDNAATAVRKPEQVAKAMVKALQEWGNSSRGVHATSLQAASGIYAARVKIARFFGCRRPDLVAFTSNVTEALNIAINGLIRPGDRVVTTAWEHNSVLRPLYRLQDEQGIRLEIVPADRQGRLDYTVLEELLCSKASAVVCTHASNLTGNVIDLRRIGELAHTNGALLIADCAQTAGTRRVNMDELGIDVLCFTGHKGLMGPQGIGGLCAREGLEWRPFKVGGTGVQSYSRTQPEQMPTVLEAGTLNGPGIAGLSAALDYIESVGLDNIAARERELTWRFYAGVKDVPGIIIYGDFAGEHGPIVTLNVANYDSASAADILAEEFGIAVRAGAHCAPLMHRALGTQEIGAVRFSFSWFTLDEDVDSAIRAVRELAENG
ncbi:MAG: aminotransferase class V-fold PLP-dependent enzyme [bacterium]|nr:aminotransferase class V-fold PLP-dependent enzyme [bacterium]